MIPNIRSGCILEFFNPETRTYYDGVVWKVIPEGNNCSIFVRFVDKIPYSDIGEVCSI